MVPHHKTMDMKKILFIAILFGVMFWVGLTLAADPSGGTLSPTVEPEPVKLDNPMGDGRTDVRAILGDIIKYAMGILGSLTRLVFVYGGFLWLISAGNPENVKKGMQTMLWAVIGIFIIFASYGILTLVFKAIGAN